ncbi:MAG: hypothetical protein CMM00_01770, partial [Rhodopirellula sp.]|nr:hypothetical protein [Rhodopirellula sp.]
EKQHSRSPGNLAERSLSDPSRCSGGVLEALQAQYLKTARPPRREVLRPAQANSPNFGSRKQSACGGFWKTKMLGRIKVPVLLFVSLSFALC